MISTSKLSDAIKLTALSTLIAGASAAYGSQLEVFPESGVLLDSNEFDLTFISATPGEVIEDLRIRIDGREMRKLSEVCSVQGHTADGRVYAQCKGIDGSAFGPGLVNLEVEAYIYPGGRQNAMVHYEILQTEDSFTKLVTLSTNSSELIELEPHFRYTVHASGESILWPENPDFNVSSPAGNGTTCTSSRCLLPGAPTGALIYRTTPNARWKLLSSNGSFEHFAPGEVEFGVNDQDPADNIGSYDITITRSPL